MSASTGAPCGDMLRRRMDSRAEKVGEVIGCYRGGGGAGWPLGW